MTLNVKAFAFTCALVWGVGLFVLTWWIIVFDGVAEEVTCFGQVYRGYRISPLGSLIGLVYGFFDGFVCGAIFAWLYNRLSGHKSPKAVL